jgi:hypothetical protein
MAWIDKALKLHKSSKNEASVFGIVLFTDSHAHVKKVIYDDDYWRAMDEVSGDRWAIFSTRAEPGGFSLPPSKPGIIAMMVPVWREPNSNKELLDTFELESTERLPCIIAFAKDKDGMLLKNVMRIEGSTEQEAFNSLKDHIQTVTDALSVVTPENLKNPAGVYSAVSLAVTHAKDWQKIKKGVKLWQWFKSIK